MFGVRYELSEHIEDSHDIKHVNCTQCNNINTTKARLKRHNITSHVDTIFEFDYIYKCDCSLWDLWKIT